MMDCDSGMHNGMPAPGMMSGTGGMVHPNNSAGMHFQMSPQAAVAGQQQGAAYRDGAGGGGNVATGAPNTVKLCKIVACEIKGTMNAFSVMGPNAASWKPVEGKHASIFGVDEGFGSGVDGATSTSADMGGASGGSSGSMLLNADLAAATNALRNVTITKATLLQSYNTFGVPLGVTVSCLPKNEVVDTGDKYTFTTIPNTAVNTPSALYEAGDTHAQAMEWMRNYGKFNASNLKTQDVLKVSL
jgi:hypothetical protein